MIEELCHCDLGLGVELPWHSHYMGQRIEIRDGHRIMGPWWDRDDIGSVAVDWKEVAKAL